MNMHALSPLFIAFQQASYVAANMLVSALWESTLLALLLYVLLKIIPGTTARIRFAVWSAGFVTLILLPFLRSPAFHRTAFTPTTNAPASPVGAHAMLHLDARWSLLVGALWISVSLFRLVALAHHSFRLRRLWSTALPTSVPGSIAALCAERPAEICTTSALNRPGVIGFFAPRILIPEWLYNQISRTRTKADCAARAGASPPPRRLVQSPSEAQSRPLSPQSGASLDRASSLPGARNGV